MHFSPVIALAAFVASASALTAGHHARGHHHAIAARMAQPAGTSGNAPVVRKRASSKRCKPRPSSSAALVAPTTHTSSVKPSTTQEVVESSTKTPEAEPTTTKETEPTATQAPTTTKETPTTTPKPATTTSTTKAAAATTTKSSSSSGTSVGFLVGINTGQGTYYSTGIGACGFANKDTDLIAAASQSLFDSYPGYDGGNPNNNPLCNKQVKATYNGKSVTVAITDRCKGCAYTDLDFSPSAFSHLADFSVGRLSGMTWEWV